MTWTRRILRLTLGRDVDEPLQDMLRGLHRGLIDRATGLSAAADLAPHHGAADELRRLATRQTELAEQLAGLFGESGVAPSAPRPAGPPETGGTNHWARLVRQLELHREARDRLLEARMSIPSERPDLLPVTDEIARAIDSALSALRLLIAQADPQALD